MTHTGGRRARIRGVVLLTLLIALTIGSWAFLGALTVWELEHRRLLEQELLFDGAQIIEAVQRFYWAAPPGQPRRLPVSIEELLEDNRYPMPVRHLRRAYVDPLTGRADWAFERLGRGIGVHSQSSRVPVKQDGFSAARADFAGKQSYREWVFLFVPPLRQPPVTAPNTGLPAPVRRIPGQR